ncbi:hypothetical protein FOL47_005396 [Perkinsus chesapeaki]|uniref:SH3 domain-containing protein n=1 Tax=Perkinsus chesapeaki TaxID=330153 RepID=A0A7J6N3H0_PERCH|nr:hypothetical protein FOL47_005396 [Perkinsus chesapeaki]
MDYIKIQLRSSLREDRANEILANVDEGILEQISSFLRDAEIAEDKHATHCNYGSVAAWYSSTNKFRFQHTQLQQLYEYIAILYGWGIPMFLTERQDENFNLVLDIDIKLGAQMTWEHCAIAEKAIIDKDGGTRFFEFIMKNLCPVFPGEKQKHIDAALFSASGYSRDSGSHKVSLHVVFPNIIVDRKRAPKIRTDKESSSRRYGRLWSASLEDDQSYDPFIAQLSHELLKFSPENRFRNVIDETSLIGRFGNRLCFCDKASRPPLVKPEGRPLKPVGLLRYSRNRQSIRWLSGKLTEAGWVRISSCRSMDGTLPKLTPWDPPHATASRVTRTGPGGSCVDVNPQNQDAFRSRRSHLRGEAGTGSTAAAGRMTESARFELDDPVSGEQFKAWLTGFDGGKWDEHIETRSISWRPSSNQGFIQYYPERRVIDVMAVDDTWLGLLTDLVAGSTSKLKARRVETDGSNDLPAEATATASAGVQVEDDGDEDMLEIKEALEDYAKSSDDEVELKAGELVRVMEVDPSGWTKARHHQRFAAQLAYAAVILASAIAWAWLQSVERAPLPDVDLNGDSTARWPIVSVCVCSLDDSLAEFAAPRLEGPFEATVSAECFSGRHTTALKAAGCNRDSHSSSCLAALRTVASNFSAKSNVLSDGLLYHIFAYSSPSGQPPKRPSVMENFAIVDVRDHKFGVDWVYNTVWFPNRPAGFHEKVASALSNPRQQLSFLLVSDVHNSARAHWDFLHSVYDAYMRPLIESRLGLLLDLDVDSQVVHGARLPGRTPKSGGAIQDIRLRSTKQLRELLTEASRLAAYLAPENTTVSVGPAEKSSVAIPGWGVVAFIPTADDYGFAAGMWHAHFRAWLGLEPTSPCDESSGWLCSDPINGVTVPELFEIAREAVIYFRSATRSSLKQLRDLVDSLPQVAVSKEIAERASKASEWISVDLVEIEQMESALAVSRRSYEESTEVLYDDSISARSYFSQEFTLAVYLPIAAPLLIPILVNFFHELRLWRKSRGMADAGHEKIE